MKIWESGFYDKDSKKMETDAVLAALFSKICQLEKRIDKLEEENTILRNIGMYDLDKKEDIYQNIADIKGYDWTTRDKFTVDSKECTISYLLYWISQYIWDNKTSEENGRYYW